MIIRALIVGFITALLVLGLGHMLMGSGLTPFNVPPVNALLLMLGGFDWGMTPALVTFLYITFWVLLFLIIVRHPTVSKGIGLAVVMWLVAMTVFSPMIGWGMFGLEGNPELDSTHPLYMAASPAFMIITFLMHMLIGAFIGGLCRLSTPKNSPDAVRSQQKKL